MDENSIKHEYFQWLCELINSNKFHDNSYGLLMRKLHNTTFYSLIENDDNRIIDGENLRDLFLETENSSGDEWNFVDLVKPCSVLEMMVGLAIRCDRDIMYDDYYGDRTDQWFWLMIDNLGLSKMDDEHFDKGYSEYVLKRFIERKYKSDGSDGGLFVVKNPRKDLRKVEIWYQMCWYFEKNGQFF